MNVVSGGEKLNTSESYDVVGDIWSPMPNMTERRVCHSLVVVKSKLFVIGITGMWNTDACEIFDSISNKFVALKCPHSLRRNRAFSIGTKIFIFEHNRSFIVTYDVDKGEWSKEMCEATENLLCFSCVRLPVC